MRIVKWAAIVVLLTHALSSFAQDNNTDKLITKQGNILQGRVTYDSLRHQYIVRTAGNEIVMPDTIVREVVRNAAPERVTDDYDFEQKSPKVYYIPEGPVRNGQPDYVLTRTGPIYKGYILEDHLKDYVVMHVIDSATITIPYSNIKHVQYSTYAWNYMGHNASRYEKPVSTYARQDMGDRLHNVGLGLTISGAVLMCVGIPMLAAGIPQATTYSGPGYGGVRITGVGAVGFIFTAIGTGLIIPGIIKLVQAKRRQSKNAAH